MEFNQDGVPLDDRNTGNIQARPPGLDTVQEFRVETNGSSAKLDRPANAIMITRSGTNEFHGAAFETGRNSGFGVARQRQDTFSTPPHLVRNEFGVSAGGPVIIPKLYNGQNRTFIFGAWEELRQRRAASTGSAVWTAAMRQGDFSGLFDSQRPQDHALRSVVRRARAHLHQDSVRQQPASDREAQPARQVCLRRGAAAHRCRRESAGRQQLLRARPDQLRSAHLHLPRRSSPQRSRPGLRPLLSRPVGPDEPPRIQHRRQSDHLRQPVEPRNLLRTLEHRDDLLDPHLLAHLLRRRRW